MSGEQIEIELDDTIASGAADADVDVSSVEKTAAEEKHEAPVEDVEALRRSLEEEKSARMAAERRAHEARNAAQSAQSEVQDTNLTLVNQAIDNIRQANAVLKSNLAVAMQNGDFEQAAEIQSSMSENAAKLLHLDQGKTAMEAQKSQPKQQQRYENADPVEQLASQLTPRSAEWVRRNPDYARDPVKYQKMIAAHNMAMADGIRPDTDEYFSEIEGYLRLRRNDEAEVPTSAAARPVQTRSSPPAAPVSRAGTATGARPNVVRLSAEEREMAQMMGMTDKEYAQNKLELRKSGRIN